MILLAYVLPQLFYRCTRAEWLVPLVPLLRRMCDRRRGIGADGVLLLEADREHDFAMRYFNADGTPIGSAKNEYGKL